MKTEAEMGVMGSTSPGTPGTPKAGGGGKDPPLELPEGAWPWACLCAVKGPLLWYGRLLWGPAAHPLVLEPGPSLQALLAPCSLRPGLPSSLRHLQGGDSEPCREGHEG